MTLRLPLVLGPNGLPEQIQPGDTIAGLGIAGLTFANVGDAESSTIPDTTNYIQTLGYNPGSPYGGGIYKRVNSLASPWVGAGNGANQPYGGLQMVPPSLVSGGIPALVYASTGYNHQNAIPYGPILQPIIAGCLAFIVAFDVPNPASTSFTDSAGNVYSLALPSYKGATAAKNCAIYCCLNPVYAAVGSTFNCYTQDSPNNQNIAINVYTVPGFTGATIDVSATQVIDTSSKTGISVTTPTLTGVTELAIGIVDVGGAALSGSGNFTYTPQAGWFDITPSQVSGRNLISCGVAAGGAPLTFDPTWPSQSIATNAIIITFKGFQRTVIDPSYWERIPSYPVHLADYGIPTNSQDDLEVVIQYFNAWLTLIAPASDVGVGGPTSFVTNLTSPATATSTSISVAVSIPSGTVIIIDTGTNSEIVTTSGVSGSGPYVLTVPPLAKSHASGAPVAINLVTPNTCTISNASPAVVTIVLAGNLVDLRQGMGIRFFGGVPPGVTAGKLYFILYGTLNINNDLKTSTFNLASTPMWGYVIDGFNTQPMGAAVVTTGPATGTISYQTYGQSWMDIVVDPGVYYASNQITPGLGCGLKRWRLIGYGARWQSPFTVAAAPWIDGNATGTTQANSFMAQFQTTNTRGTGNWNKSITLTAGNFSLASHYFPGSWVILMQNELQISAPGNWNQYTFEYAKVQSSNPSTGEITFWDDIQNNYQSTLPVFSARTTAWSGSLIGPATIVQMPDTFDQEVEIIGFTINGTTEQNFAGMLSITLIDCIVYAWGFKTGPFPSSMRKFSMRNCRCFNYSSEIDKMIDYIEYIDTIFDSQSYVFFQSASINKALIKRCRMPAGIGGCPKQLDIEDSYIAGQLLLGPVFGVNERMRLVNSNIQELGNGNEAQQVLQLAAVTFSTGTIKFASGNMGPFGIWYGPGTPSTFTACPITWGIPGAKIAIVSPYITSGNGISPNIGVNTSQTFAMIATFTVLKVYTDGSDNFCVDTTLAYLPSTTIKIHGTVSGNTLTVTSFDSPTSDACLLQGMAIQSTSGSLLPAGTIISQDLGVPNTTSNLGAYTLSHSATIGSSTSFTVTGTLSFLPHPSPRMIVDNCTNGRQVADMQGHTSGDPIFSYVNRAFGGFTVDQDVAELFFGLCGKLDRPGLDYLTIDVIKAYTGAGGAGSCFATIYMFGWKQVAGNIYPIWVSEVIDLTVLGSRTITAVATTPIGGSADSLSTIPWFLTGGHFVVSGPINGGDTLDMMPYFQITGHANQGINFAAMTINTTALGIDGLADTVTGSFGVQ